MYAGPYHVVWSRERDLCSAQPVAVIFVRDALSPGPASLIALDGMFSTYRRVRTSSSRSSENRNNLQHVLAALTTMLPTAAMSLLHGPMVINIAGSGIIV
eukprot:TRINITY_DN15763_c0_g1_i3.p2 TRINITY_DN15763_c0_g1~~TRINITY_DN15763_c0_g1_i3.p2  ORF type:complete len:100 (-),score=7.71 TRINITY_DN15763_c0_g1_i3:62-361(-)